MFNFKTKNGQKLLAAGNWLWSLFTINLTWFLLNFTFILTSIIWAQLPISGIFYRLLLVLAAMLIIFVIPSLIAVFATVNQWRLDGNGTFFKVMLQNWLAALQQVKVTLPLGLVAASLLVLNKLVYGHPLPHMFVLTSAFIYCSLLIAVSYTAGQQTNVFLPLILAHPGRLVVVTAIFIGLIVINFILQLAFLLVICSVALAAVITDKFWGQPACKLSGQH